MDKLFDARNEIINIIATESLTLSRLLGKGEGEEAVYKGVYIDGLKRAKGAIDQIIDREIKGWIR